MSLALFITLTEVPRMAQARSGFGSEKPCKFLKGFGLGMLVIGTGHGPSTVKIFWQVWDKGQ
jgi:hypothetical protein